MKKLALILISMSIAVFFALSCGEEVDVDGNGENGGSSITCPTDNVNSLHSVNNGDSCHAEGNEDPKTNCSGCHGSNLEGQGNAPSCTSCHDPVPVVSE